MTEPNLDKLLAECGKKAGTGNLTYGQIQAVKAIVDNQVREARSECLVVIDGLLELKERYGEVKDEADSEWNEALNTATAKIKELGE